ncbi:MAG: MerR family transcriptional regulator [Acidobacteriota bacterium]|nr:MerR family transcriptional regulator [Acidobacteriota bacterium]
MGAPRGAGEIPDKLYFRIGDVAEICDVPAYVLRFWETEFSQLKPNKGGTGQRLYRRRDVEVALRIKRLLYDEGYTIPGARQLLKTEQRQPAPQLSLLGPVGPDPRQLDGVRRELEAILAILSRPAGAPPGPRRTMRGGARGMTRGAVGPGVATDHGGAVQRVQDGDVSAVQRTGEIPFDPPVLE